jgi:hypothetical protein
MEFNRSGFRAAARAAARGHFLGRSMVAGAVAAALAIAPMLGIADALRDATTRTACESRQTPPSFTYISGGLSVAMCKETDGACTPRPDSSRRAA